jgi:hypothetical protein
VLAVVLVVAPAVALVVPVVVVRKYFLRFALLLVEPFLVFR